MAKQGFNYISNNPYVYQECDAGESAALGLDNTSQVWKLKVLAATGAEPTGTAHITIDPAAAGNITVTPNGAGKVVLSSLGLGAVLSSATGELSSTGASTAGYVLTANGGVLAPTFQALPASGITTLNGDTGSATGATVTLAGTANQIVTSAAGATVTLALASSVTLANDITLTNGDANIINADAGTTSPITYFKKNRAGTTLTSGDLTGTIKFSGHDGTQYTDSARITSTSSGTIANTRVAGDLKFYTHPNSAAADPTLRLTIASTGAITIATPDSGTALSIDGGGILLKIGALNLSNGNTNTTGTIVVPSASSTLAQITLNSTNVNDRLLTTVGSNNVFLGYTCGNPSITNPNGTDNIGLGFHAAASLTTGAYNAFCGSESGVLVAGGSGNACLGYRSYYLATGSYNCSLGSRSLYNVTGAASYNISIGYDSSSAYTSNESSNIILNSAAVVSESNTLRIGSATGTGNKELKSAYICGIYTTAATPSGTAKVTLTDSNNLQYCLANTTGALLHVAAAGTAPIWSTGPTVTDLTLTGVLKLPTTTSTVGQIQINSTTVYHEYGTSNVFSGSGAGNFTLTTANAKWNTALGGTALSALVGTNANEAAKNVALGYASLSGATEASYCTATGYNSGISVTTGLYNSYYGYNSGYSANTTGSYNLILGSSSGSGWSSDESSNILIGHGIAGTAGEDNVLRIGSATGTGNGELNAAYIAGITGKTSTSGAAVYVNSSNLLGTSTSNRDSKEEIADIGDESLVLYKLRPRSFKFKNDIEPKPKQYGMIAEEVEEFFPEMVLYDKEGKPWNLAYQFLAPMLVNEIQKLEKRVAALEAALSAKGK